MKKLITLGLLATSLFAFNYNLKPTKVANDVWCFFGALEAPTKENGGNMSNSCYIKTNNSYVLVDSGPTYKFAKQAYEAMQKIDNLPVKLVINTHAHDDHWLGSGFYKEKFNAKLIGTSNINDFKEGDKTRMHHMLSHDAIEGTKIVKLDEIISDVTSIKVGNKEFTIIPVGTKAHSPEDLFVYMSDEKVLFSGDLVMNGRITSNREGSVIGQLKALDMIESQGWDVLVPGHGFDTSKTAMDDAKLYFKLLKQRVLEAVEEDVGANAVTKIVKLEEFKNHKMYDMLNSRNIFEAYGELEFYDGE
jgi:cyclase